MGRCVATMRTPAAPPLPAIRRCHRPRASVHAVSPHALDRMIRRDRPRAHPEAIRRGCATALPHRAPHIHLRRRRATCRTPRRMPYRHTLRLRDGGGSACCAAASVPHTCLRTAVALPVLQLRGNCSTGSAGGPTDLARGACANPAGHAEPPQSMIPLPCRAGCSWCDRRVEATGTHGGAHPSGAQVRRQDAGAGWREVTSTRPQGRPCGAPDHRHRARMAGPLPARLQVQFARSPRWEATVRIAPVTSARRSAVCRMSCRVWGRISACLSWARGSRAGRLAW
jgi:hypothetical protein